MDASTDIDFTFAGLDRSLAGRTRVLITPLTHAWAPIGLVAVTRVDSADNRAGRPRVSGQGTDAFELVSAVPLDGSRVRLVVAANFTAEPMRHIVLHWMRVLGIEVSLAFTPYYQIVQQLIDPASALSCNGGGINVLLLRPDIDPGSANGNPEQVQRDRGADAIDQLVHLIDTRVRTLDTSWIVAGCPPVPPPRGSESGASVWDTWERRLAAGLEATPGTHVIRSSEVLRLYGVTEYYDEPGHRLGDMPYTSGFFAAMGTMVARLLHRLVMPPRKVLVLDCDNTLWSGTCGEDGPADLVVDGPRRYLQEFFLDRMRAGALLSLCSRNEETDVWRVFDEHPDMRLRRDHLVAWRINWDEKSQNLCALAEELQLGLDTFIFVDDDAAVCAEVQTRLPQVLTVQLPADADRIPSLLEHIWAFDLPPSTAEDLERTQQYLLRRERERWRGQAATPEEFERALDVRVQIRAAQESELARIAQLSTRTTQFNCTLRRRSVIELRQLLAQPDSVVLVVHVSDRHGDYGLVGTIIGRACDEALIVDDFLLSCRALGRNVELRMIREVERLAGARGCAAVHLRFVPGVRNAVARAFLDSGAPGWRCEPGDTTSPLYVCTLRPSSESAPVSAAASPIDTE